MSAAFERDANGTTGDLLYAQGDSFALPASYSVCAWVYMPSLPGANVRHTVWFYSRKDPAYHIRLGVRNGVFRLDASSSHVPPGGLALVSTLTLSSQTWYLVTVSAEDTGNGVVYRLRVNGSTVSSAAVQSASVSGFYYFALGQGASGGADPGTFLVEQVGIFGRAVGAGEHDEMYDERRPPTDLANPPGVNHWALVGHSRHGLPVSVVDALYPGGIRSSLPNKPPLVADAPTSPRWSVRNPRLVYSRVTRGSFVVARPRKHAVSRLYPHFYMFQQPGAAPGNDDGEETEHPVWSDPSFTVMARVKYDLNANNAADARRFLPPFHLVPLNWTNSFPWDSVTVLAQVIGDWAWYQGFVAGAGSEHPDYEGALFLQGLGVNTKSETPGPPYNGPGADVGIPLEQHPQDAVAGGWDPVASLYRAGGAALVKEYCEEFWGALAEELDRQGLCRPKRFHWDYEGSPRPARLVTGSAGGGSWTFHLPPNEPRYTTEVLVRPGTTLEDMWTDPAKPSDVGNVQPNTNMFLNAINHPFLNWTSAWKVHMIDDALSEAVFEPAAGGFPLALWSNYDGWVADNPDWRFVDNAAYWVYNSWLSTIRADFSAPVLYGPFNYGTFKTDSSRDWGRTSSTTIFRRVNEARIDACVNARNPRPLAVWIPMPGARIRDKGGYTTTRYDVWNLSCYAWQRGSDEFSVFAQPEIRDPDTGVVLHPAADYRIGYEVCRDLAMFVQLIAVNQDRTGRLCRLGRRI